MPRLTLSIVTDLTQIGTLAAQQTGEYEAFRYYIETMWDHESRSDAELDALVDSLTAQVLPHIDCTACANCCRSMAVGLEPDDIPVLAQTLGLPPAEIVTRYVDQECAPAGEAWGVFRQSPCPMLDGSLCTVYHCRPRACRDYPFLTPDFRWLMEPIMEGAGRCPIIFNVIERLKVALGW